MTLPIKSLAKLCFVLMAIFTTSSWAAELDGIFQAKDCFTANLDMQGLMELNNQALHLFPYIIDLEPKTAAKKVSYDEFANVFNEKIKNDRQFQAEYKAFQDNVKGYFSSGGVSLSNLKPGLEYEVILQCDFYRLNQDSIKIVEQIQDLSPLLFREILRISVATGIDNFSGMIKGKLDNAFFLLFGYSAWGAKNRREQVKYRMFTSCATKTVAEGYVRKLEDWDSYPECRDQDREKILNYRVFLTSTLLSTIFINYQVNVPEQKSPSSAFSDLLSEYSKITKDNPLGELLGGFGMGLIRENEQMILSYQHKKESSQK